MSKRSKVSCTSTFAEYLSSNFPTSLRAQTSLTLTPLVLDILRDEKHTSSVLAAPPRLGRPTAMRPSLRYRTQAVGGGETHGQIVWPGLSIGSQSTLEASPHWNSPRHPSLTHIEWLSKQPKLCPKVQWCLDS